MLRKLALVLLGLAALLSLAAGMRYWLTDEFMPYHAMVAGRSWAELPTGVQTIIIGMLRIVGAGFAAGGLSLAWLLYPMSRGAAWPRWAALSIAAVLWLPTLAVTFMLKTQAPSASPPTVPTLVILALVVVAVFADLVSARARTPRA
jgi:hypothetical protein